MLIDGRTPKSYHLTTIAVLTFIKINRKIRFNIMYLTNCDSRIMVLKDIHILILGTRNITLHDKGALQMWLRVQSLRRESSSFRLNLIKWVPKSRESFPVMAIERKRRQRVRGMSQYWLWRWWWRRLQAKDSDWPIEAEGGKE